MPMYGSVFHEAIASPPWPSLSLAAWLAWTLRASLPFPCREGDTWKALRVFFPLSLLMWKFNFLLEIISFLPCRKLMNHKVILKQDIDYTFRKLCLMSNNQSQKVPRTLLCLVWWLMSLILALGRLRQEK